MKKGFTLIEVLIVIFIITISGAIVVPIIFYSIENISFKTAVKHLAAVMRFARSQSINHKTLQVLEINIKEGSYVLKEKKIEGGFYMNQDEGNNSGGSGATSGGPLNPGDQSGDGSGSQGSKGGMVVYDVTHKLGENNRFDRILLDGADTKDETVSIFFFPKGNTSGGKFYIANSKDKVFSITLDKITGRVIINKEEKDYNWQT